MKSRSSTAYEHEAPVDWLHELLTFHDPDQALRCGVNTHGLLETFASREPELQVGQIVSHEVDARLERDRQDRLDSR